MTRPELHPACAAFPPVSQDELQKLADDIKANGLLDAITLYDDMILDGRCRWDACEIAGVDPRTTEYVGDDPISFVISKNERRRHLPMHERAFIAEALATLQNGGDRKGISFVNTKLVERTDAAAAMNVSKNAIDEARIIRKQAADNVIDMVKTDKVALQTAARAVYGTPKSEQETWKSGKDVKAAAEAKKKQKARTKPQPTKTIHIPYLGANLPTAEESGAPPPGSSVAEHDAFAERYGRVPLYPKRIKELLECERHGNGLISALTTAANASHPDADKLFEYIVDMMAHERKDKTERDFPASARAWLASLRKSVPLLMDRLADIKDRLDAFSVAHSLEKVGD